MANKGTRKPPAARPQKLAPQALTVNELAERYLQRCRDRIILGGLKPRTAANYERSIRTHILPAIGPRLAQDVTEGDVFALFSQLAIDRPNTANKCLSLVRLMFEKAERWGVTPYGSNPALDIRRIPQGKLPQAPSPGDVARLGLVLAEVEEIGFQWWRLAQLVRLLALTGRRLSEIMHGRKEWVNLERQSYHLPDSKSGPADYHIPAPAAPVFKAVLRIRPESPWLFPCRRGCGPFSDPYPIWREIRERAGLEGLTFHQLRHLHASAARDSGYELDVIGKLLGHRCSRSTEIYAHWITDSYRRAAENTSALVASWLNHRAQKYDQSSTRNASSVLMLHKRKHERLLGLGCSVLAMRRGPDAFERRTFVKPLRLLGHGGKTIRPKPARSR